MESFRSDDNNVGKYVHNDGSETAIKCVSSCDTILDPATGNFYNNNVDRQKYSIFISSSAGCFMKCKFCYLTIKNSKFLKLSGEQIEKNVLEALTEELKDNPSIKNRYVKLCWMGMGENSFIEPIKTQQTTIKLLEYISNNASLGLDGVDIATVFPLIPTDWINQFNILNKKLLEYPVNPNNVKSVHSSNSYKMEERSRLRLFYSLHSLLQEERDFLIPNAQPLSIAIPELEKFNEITGCNLIFHYMFMDGQNDSDKSVDALLEFMQTRKQHELRILRYNSCDYTPYHESPKFNSIIAKLSKEIPRIKVQISVGTEMQAACGQFIVKNWAEPST